MAEAEGFALDFCKGKYVKQFTMLCKNLRSAAKNSHTGLFFHPAGAALVRIPLINKTKKTLRIDFIYPKGFVNDEQKGASFYAEKGAGVHGELNLNMLIFDE